MTARRPVLPLSRTLVAGSCALVLTACGGGTGDEDAYVTRMERGCRDLAGVGATYQQALATAARGAELLDDREVVGRVRGPVRALLTDTARAYDALLDAPAPERWRRFQDDFRERLGRVTPALRDAGRRMAEARDRDDVQRATATLSRLGGDRPLQVPDDLLERAPACRALTEVTAR